MWLKKKILVPCDFAETSRQACDAALELAQALRVPMMLVHVVPLEAGIYLGIPTIPAPEFTTAVENSARTLLANLAARFRNRGVEVETAVIRGVAWEEIIEAAKRYDAGLIVMGTHGRRGLPRAILGSVAEKVVRLSTTPVLTVHETDGERKKDVAAPATP